MNPLLMFFENYRTALAGLHIAAKIFVTLVLAAIIVAAIFAIIGWLNMIF